MCDVHGFELGLAAGLPGGSQTECHDECQDALFDILRSAGMTVEVKPSHIFHTLIPPDFLLRPGRPATIVPDGAIACSLPPVTARPLPGVARLRHGNMPEQVLLFDVKTVHGGGPCYHSRWAHEEQSGAVAERAWQVGRDYESHARRLDLRLSPAGTTPILDRLSAYTRTRGLVFGNYAEASPDVHALVAAAADLIARRDWRRMGFRTVAEARSIVITRLRRELGVRVARAFARYRVRRIPFIGVPRAALQRVRRPAHAADAHPPGLREQDYIAAQSLYHTLALR